MFKFTDFLKKHGQNQTIKPFVIKLKFGHIIRKHFAQFGVCQIDLAKHLGLEFLSIDFQAVNIRKHLLLKVENMPILSPTANDYVLKLLKGMDIRFIRKSMFQVSIKTKQIFERMDLIYHKLYFQSFMERAGILDDSESTFKIDAAYISYSPFFW